jgi:hypothetical protein
MGMHDDTEWVPHPRLIEFTDLIFKPTLDAGMELSRKLDEAFIEADRLQTEAYASGRKDEREEMTHLLGWAYSKLVYRSFDSMEDALAMDEIKLILMGAE